jgi:RNA polymerase sigma factor (sigma-70 family)
MYLLSLEGLSEEHEIQVSAEGTPETESEFMEIRKKLYHAVSELPELEQKVILLFYQEGLNQKNIASRLRLSRSKVNRVLARSVTELRNKLE